MKSIDVVVPIYGAPHHVKRCVESLLANTKHAGARFILADDASPDAEIPRLLDRFSEDSRVQVVVNESNIGFVRTCNRAMAASDHDVVLLNSDTAVGPGWLQRLESVAYLIDRVGSVTPLSNNAEVCSAPWWFETNEYPDRIDVEALDAVAADLGIVGPIDLPTGVGFCLFLRRSALDEVGLFDEWAFGMGYAEENDLCARMRHAGFLNLLAPNVFVEHAGGASFSGSGRLAANLETLLSRWPAYRHSVAAYRQAQPLRGVHSRFGLELAVRGRDPDALRPLFLLQYRTRIGSRGGVGHHTEDLIDGAGARFDPLVLTYEADQPVVQWDADGAGTSFPAAVSAEDDQSHQWVDRLLNSGVDLVHIQHAKRFPLDTLEYIQRSAVQRGLPVVWSLHDYYTACPCTQLVHPDGEECPVPKACEYCESLADEERGITLLAWRRRYRKLVLEADLLICPSQTAAGAQRRILALDSTPTVIPHGLDGERTETMPPQRSTPRVVILGYSAPQKGGQLARALIRNTRRRVDWIVLGRDHIRGVSPSAVRFLGTYERENLGQILEDLAPDAVALLSNWQETYLYTLSEAWRSGIPVFGTAVGAIAERIRSSGGGVLIDPEHPRLAAAEIVEVLNDPARMQSLRDEAAEVGRALPTAERMADRYVELYEGLVGGRRNPPQVTHPQPSVNEWAGWIGSFPVTFPTDSARPLRVGEVAS